MKNKNIFIFVVCFLAILFYVNATPESIINGLNSTGNLSDVYGYPRYYISDGNSSTSVSYPNSGTHWINGTYILDTSYTIYYFIANGANDSNSATNKFYIYGSNDNFLNTDLIWNSSDNVDFDSGDANITFNISATISYSYYQIKMITSAGGAGNNFIRDWWLFGNTTFNNTINIYFNDTDNASYATRNVILNISQAGIQFLYNSTTQGYLQNIILPNGNDYLFKITSTNNYYLSQNITYNVTADANITVYLQRSNITNCTSTCNVSGVYSCYSNKLVQVCALSGDGCKYQYATKTCSSLYQCSGGECVYTGINTDINTPTTETEQSTFISSLSYGTRLLWFFIFLVVVFAIFTFIGMSLNMIKLGLIVGILLDLFFIVISSIESVPLIGGLIPVWLLLSVTFGGLAILIFVAVRYLTGSGEG